MKRMMNTTALLVSGCLNLMLTGCLPETDEAIAAAIENLGNTANQTLANATDDDPEVPVSTTNNSVSGNSGNNSGPSGHGGQSTGSTANGTSGTTQPPPAVDPVPPVIEPGSPVNPNVVIVPIDPNPVDPVVQPPPPPPPPTGPLFPNLRPVCNAGDLNCRLRLDDVLGGKLMVFDTSDGNGGAIRNYLYLCASASYTLIQTVYDGVSPPSTPNIQQFFVSPPGERIVFVTVGVYDGDAWTTQYVQTGDLAIAFRISLVEPTSAAHLTGQQIFIVLNFDEQGNVYANGSPVQWYHAGDVCFGG
ncbi:MAG: hypothetical protein ACKVS9_04220 [Phycisphaerae bacterium]